MEVASVGSERQQKVDVNSRRSSTYLSQSDDSCHPSLRTVLLCTLSVTAVIAATAAFIPVYQTSISLAEDLIEHITSLHSSTVVQSVQNYFLMIDDELQMMLDAENIGKGSIVFANNESVWSWLGASERRTGLLTAAIINFTTNNNSMALWMVGLDAGSLMAAPRDNQTTVACYGSNVKATECAYHSRATFLPLPIAPVLRHVTVPSVMAASLVSASDHRKWSGLTVDPSMSNTTAGYVVSALVGGDKAVAFVVPCSRLSELLRSVQVMHHGRAVLLDVATRSIVAGNFGISSSSRRRVPLTCGS